MNFNANCFLYILSPSQSPSPSSHFLFHYSLLGLSKCLLTSFPSKPLPMGILNETSTSKVQKLIPTYGREFINLGFLCVCLGYSTHNACFQLSIYLKILGFDFHTIWIINTTLHNYSIELLIHLLLGFLGSSHFLAVGNRAAVNTNEQVPL